MENLEQYCQKNGLANLLDEWDEERNIGKLPKDYMPKSGKKIWWKCSKNHSWEAVVHTRVNGGGCPYCAGKYATADNNLEVCFPEIAKEWNYSKNAPLEPKDILPKSGKFYWWICNRGHEWEAKVSNRANGRGCPYCNNVKVLVGYNDLKTTMPQLVAEWNYERNGELEPTMVSAGSDKNVWWKCKEGHEWQAVIGTRKAGNGCPYCANQMILAGYNDLSTINPVLVKEWNYEKNGSLKPSMVAANSNKKVWWKCKKGHEWQALINSRNRGVGCPFCAGKKVLVGYNDFETLYPKLCDEWNYEKNGNSLPNMFTARSGKKVWWKCDYGHKWKASIDHRVGGRRCPICQKEIRTSFPEQAIFFYVKQHCKDAISGDMSLGMELDIYIPSKRIGIEYDGYNWHYDKESLENQKNQLCKEKNITLIRVREKGLTNFENCVCIVRNNNNSDSELSEIVEQILKMIGISNGHISVEKDRQNIMSMYMSNKKERSLLLKNPDVSQEWNYEKNGDLHPSMISANSNRKVWWKCRLGHEWEAVVCTRNKGIGCPICGNEKRVLSYKKHALEKTGSLEEKNPALCKEWNYEKNECLLPSEITSGSQKKVWWKCCLGHEWESTVANRSRGTGCPYCANKKVLSGFNDLETQYPNISKEWNFEKNMQLTPSEVTGRSNKKVWWRCMEGHEWQAHIVERTVRGYNCPFCSGRKKNIP